MDPTTRSQRHAELWEAGNTRVRRTALSGVIFAVVVLFKVIQPHAEEADSRKALAELEQKESGVAEELSRVRVLESRLAELSLTVERAEWERHKDDLIRSFATGNVRDAQEEADRAVRNIAQQIREEVVMPLEAIVAESGVSGPLAEQPAAMLRAVDDWEESQLGARWYSTIHSKERAVGGIGSTVGSINERAERLVEDLKTGVEEERERLVGGFQGAVDAERARLGSRQAELAAKIEKTRADIQRALDEAVPAWASGLVSVDTMVILYPWLVVGLAVYLVACGLVAARHYHGLAKTSGWPAEDRGDPLLSSLWTLTWRGSSGTALTLLCYAGVLLGLGVCLHRAVTLQGAWPAPGWLLQLVVLGALAVALAAPLRARSAPG